MPTIEEKKKTKAAAYDTYLTGLLKSLTPGPEANLEAGRAFESAIAQDPKFARAYAARAYMDILAGGTYVPYKEIAPRVRELAAKALELDPDCPDVHTVLGTIYHQIDLDYLKAEQEFRKALELDPSSWPARIWYAILLGSLQRFEEAKEQVREAIRINPGLEIGWNWVSLLHYLSGDLATGADVAEAVCNRNPASFVGHLLTSYCYAATGRVTDALKEVEALPIPKDLEQRTGRALLATLLGKKAEAELLVKELEGRAKYSFVPEIWRASLCAALGMKEEALNLLEHDLREGDKMLWGSYQYPEFDQLRGEPRFEALLKAYNLPSVQVVRLPFASPPPKGPKAPIRATV